MFDFMTPEATDACLFFIWLLLIVSGTGVGIAITEWVIYKWTKWW